MGPLLFLFLNLPIYPLKLASRAEAENAALRHQLVVLERKLRGRVEITSGDPLLCVPKTSSASVQ